MSADRDDWIVGTPDDWISVPQIAAICTLTAMSFAGPEAFADARARLPGVTVDPPLFNSTVWKGPFGFGNQWFKGFGASLNITRSPADDVALALAARDFRNKVSNNWELIYFQLHPRIIGRWLWTSNPSGLQLNQDWSSLTLNRVAFWTTFLNVTMYGEKWPDLPEGMDPSHSSYEYDLRILSRVVGPHFISPADGVEVYFDILYTYIHIYRRKKKKTYIYIRLITMIMTMIMTIILITLNDNNHHSRPGTFVIPWVPYQGAS